MRQLLLTAAIFLTGTLLLAQVQTPTINYQGRAQTASGEPLTGNQSVTFRIYDAPTGGTALFTETHASVPFSGNGTFTAVIGGATPGGIPTSVGFDSPRWIGVAISGLNGGAEIPRLRFHGSPYAMYANEAAVAEDADSSRAANRADRADVATSAERADVAERADTADFARGVAVPLVLESASDEATLELRNTGGRGLLARGGLLAIGAPYASISDGVDSTSRYFVAGDSAGTDGNPSPGALYGDNVPLAWGTINRNGEIIADFGISRVEYSAVTPGRYVIHLDNPVATDSKGRRFPQLAPTITPRIQQSGQPTQILAASWDFNYDVTSGQARSDSFVVTIYGTDAGVDTPFSVVVFGRPTR